METPPKFYIFLDRFYVANTIIVIYLFFLSLLDFFGFFPLTNELRHGVQFLAAPLEEYMAQIEAYVTQAFLWKVRHKTYQGVYY